MFLYLTLVFIVVIVIGTYILSSIKLQDLSKTKDEMQRYAQLIDEQIINESSPFEFQHGFENLTSNMQCSILNSRGITIASTALPLQNYENAAVISAVSGVETFAYSNTWYNYARQSLSDNKYIILIRTDSNVFLSGVTKMTFTLIFSLILAMVIAGVIGFLFAGTLTVPIINLTRKAHEIASGNLSQEIPVNSNDEIGQLTMSFNHMAKELNATMMKLTNENNKMEIIRQNMTDGVMYYNADGTLAHINYACMELLELDENGIDFANFAARFDFENDLYKYKTHSDFAIEFGERCLNINFVPYYDANELLGLLIIVQDITKHRKLDNMRKEFVANVSHEIRTPLTSIKAYTETLLNNKIDLSLQSKFLEIINEETDRIALLAKDLLELSRLDNDQMKLQLSKVNLVTVIDKSIEQNKVISVDRNIIFNQTDSKFIVIGDIDRLNQVFSNIISNAIKYSAEHSQIEISIDETNKYYRVYVKDNGYGIPKEDLPHIFDRFYRVDKARSRKMGGTGLGLSIAKKIIELHNGTITANSKLGEGTTIIIRFNKLGDEQ